MKRLLILSLLIFSEVSEAKLSVMQGVTSDSTTQVNFIGQKGKTYQISLRDPEGETLSPSEQTTISKPFSVKTVVKAKFKGLSLRKSYELTINDEQGGNLDRRHLKALDIKKSMATIAFASCMDDFYKTQQTSMWKELLGHGADILIILGDNVYADRRNGHPIIDVNPRVLWERYTETRDLLELYKSDNLIPIIATWDDHDFGQNDGGLDFKYKKESTETFNAFFSQDSVKGVYDLGPGVSSTLRVFGQVFYLLDDRSFRTPDHKGGPEQTQLGVAQENWLLENLVSTRHPSWLINGGQWFGGYHQFESFEGDHPENFKIFMNRLKSAVAPVIFISGDRHLAELMKIEKEVLGYETYEFTTSAIHANVYPSTWDKTPNRRQIAGVAGTFNYGIVKTSQEDTWKINVKAFGPGSKLLFERDLKIAKPAKSSH